MSRIHWLEAEDTFPAVDQALDEPNGLLAASGELTPERILEAYRRGIFPWYGPGEPVLWWSPDPRLVLEPSALRVSRSFAKVLRNKAYEVRFDSDFERVMRACAEPRPDQHGTWISDEIVAAYTELHRRGFAHSVETWIDGELAGGLYGVSIGRMFYGESMFSRQADASKIALAHLCRVLREHDHPLIDCQMETAHLARMGGMPLPREEFCRTVAELVAQASIIKAWDFHFISPASL